MTSANTQPDDPSADDGYQALSVAAVVALVAGLFSPAVFLWAPLIVLPCVAVAVALVALGNIARAGGAGRSLALGGLALGVLSLSSWVGYQNVYRSRLHAQAAPTAEMLLELISDGRDQEAYLLTLGAKERAAAATFFRVAASADDPPAKESPADGKRRFFELPAMASLVASRPFAGFERVDSGRVQPTSGGRVSLVQTYEVEPQSGPTRRFNLGLEGTTPANAPPFWRVVGVSPAESDG